jgi:predicted DNA-binding antitoxin AbrB/MazE fold protein
MPEIITAVYEKGTLWPLHSVKLWESQTVRLQIVADESMDQTDEAIRQLVAAGIVTPPSAHPAVDPISEDELVDLAERLGRVPGKPLSEIIIEDV